MKKFFGFITLAVGIVIAIYSFVEINNGIPGYWLFLSVGVILLITGFKVMKS